MMLMDWLEVLSVVLITFSYIGQGLLVLFVITWILDNRLKILERFKLTWEFIARWTVYLLVSSAGAYWLYLILWSALTNQGQFLHGDSWPFTPG